MKERLQKLLEVRWALNLSIIIAMTVTGVVLDSLFLMFVSGFNAALYCVLLDMEVRNEQMQEHLKGMEAEFEKRHVELIARMADELQAELKARGIKAKVATKEEIEKLIGKGGES